MFKMMSLASNYPPRSSSHLPCTTIHHYPTCTNNCHHMQIKHARHILCVYSLYIIHYLCHTGIHFYRRVRIECPWAGNLRMQRKRGVGAKHVSLFVRKWHVVSVHCLEVKNLHQIIFFTIISYHPGELNLKLSEQNQAVKFDL